MPRLDLNPLYYLLKRTLGRSVSLEAKASRIWQIAPASSNEVLPPIYLADEIDRIDQVTRLSTAENENLRLFGPKVNYPASQMYEFTNATIADWNVFHQGNRGWQLENAKIKPAYYSQFESFDQAILCSTIHSNQYFGHWLTDQLSTELLARDFQGTAITCTSKFTYNHAKDYRDILNLFAQPVKRAVVKSMLLPIDIGHNKSRQDRLLDLRLSISSKLKSGHPDRICLTYIGRGKSGAARDLVNETEVKNWVKSLGGTILEPELMTVKEMYRILSISSCVLGVEGSGLTHAIISMPSDATLLVIQPPEMFHNILKTYTDVVGQRYGFVVADRADRGFFQPISRLGKLYEMALCV